MLAYMYQEGKLGAWNGAINLASDTLKIMLLTSSYAPNTDSDVQYSTISANEVTGTGYTAGGLALTGVTVAIVAANSWTGVAAVSTAYNVGKIVRPATGNGFLYRCVAGGTSGGSAPAWGTVVGETTTDSGVVWLNVGSSAVKFSASNPSWTTATITARYAVVYDTTPTTKYLISGLDFGSNVTGTAGTFAIIFDADGGVACQTY